MPSGGFGDGAFHFFEKVEANPSWDHVASLQSEWEREVHEPMERLLDALGDEFGRDGHAYNLHRDPYLWSHQVGVVSVADTIVYRAVLSLRGLLTEVGWLRSVPDQVQRYRLAVGTEGSGEELSAILDRLRESGHAIVGKRLRSHPRGWPVDHSRIDLARHLTMGATKLIPPDKLQPGSTCFEAVSMAWRQARPLVDWLLRYVGPRDGHQPD